MSGISPGIYGEAQRRVNNINIEINYFIKSLILRWDLGAQVFEQGGWGFLYDTVVSSNREMANVNLYALGVSSYFPISNNASCKYSQKIDADRPDTIHSVVRLKECKIEWNSRVF